MAVAVRSDKALRPWCDAWLLRFAAWKNQSSRIVYTVRVVMKEALQRDVQLKAIIGPGDDGEPVITIMTLDEPEN